MQVLPWEAKRKASEISRIRERCAGDPVKLVSYVGLPGETWPCGHRHDVVHDVDVAVELTLLSGAKFVVTWVTNGLHEGICLELLEGNDASEFSKGDRLDVSEHEEWAEYIGSRISGLSLAWHTPDASCGEEPWSVRLDTAEGKSVVVALGESQGDAFAYLPDSLLVFFSPAMAESYRIPASSTSAWGESA